MLQKLEELGAADPALWFNMGAGFANRDLYEQAEQILVEGDAAIIRIYWYTGVEVTKPYVNRTFGKGGQNMYEKWTMDK